MDPVFYGKSHVLATIFHAPMLNIIKLRHNLGQSMEIYPYAWYLSAGIGLAQPMGMKNEESLRFIYQQGIFLQQKEPKRHKFFYSGNPKAKNSSPG
jgi:hypothetical protein